MTDISKLSIEELRQLNKAVVERIRVLTRRADEDAITSLRPNTKVVVRSDRKAINGVIVSVQKSKVTVKEDATGKLWTCPASMVAVTA